MKSLLIIFIGAIAVLFAGLGKKEGRNLPLVLLTLAAALGALIWDITSKTQWSFEIEYVSMNMLVFDYVALAFEGILIIASLWIFGLFNQKETVGADLQGLLLFSLCGGIILTAFTNLVMLFLGLEILSIPLYVLAGSRKQDLKGNEAAIKYFLMGAFSTVFFLFGCALVYGATGVLDIESIRRSTSMFEHMGAMPSMASVGIIFILIGLCFKVAAVPFHFWSPDVYEGSPNRATVFMAVVVKIAAFAAFFRMFSIGFQFATATWMTTLCVIAAVTIIVGNVLALKQTNVKRTLAYSSVAHAGYMLLAILAQPENGVWALLLYSVAYAAGSTTIFYLFNKVSANGDESFEAFNNFGKNNKLAGIALAIAMFSLAGIPITAGFAGKYSLFTAAFADHKWVVIVALVGSAISIGYYFRIFKNAFFSHNIEIEGVKIESNWLEKIILAMLILVILTLGIAPSLITKFQFVSI